jgi:HAE1 family hydrophobic/amphiphilic exporter-1
VLLFVVSIAIIPLIGTGFMPPSAEKFATVDVAYPSGTPAETVDGMLQEIEAVVADLDDIVYYQASVGTASGFDVVSGDNKGSLFLKYDEEADMDLAIDELKTAVEPFKSDDVRVAVAQVDVSGAGANSIDLVVTGPSSEALETAATAIENMMEGVDGLENISSNVTESRKQITIEVDQQKAAEYGLNTGIILGSVRGFVAQEAAGVVTIDGNETDLVYSTEIGDIESVATIANYELTSPLGETVKLSDVALVQEIDVDA